MAGAQQPGQFRPAELDAGDLGPSAEAQLLGTARELEWLAASEEVGPGAGFADRVMAAVSREPAPRPLAAAIGATRRRSPIAALSALGDLWRVAFSGGRPFAVRVPAIALVVLLVVGSVGAGALGAGAFAGLLRRAPDATPALSSSPLAPSPPTEPSASPSPSPTEANCRSQAASLKSPRAPSPRPRPGRPWRPPRRQPCPRAAASTRPARPATARSQRRRRRPPRRRTRERRRSRARRPVQRRRPGLAAHPSRRPGRAEAPGASSRPIRPPRDPAPL